MRSQPWSKVSSALAAGALAVGGLLFVSPTASATACDVQACPSPLITYTSPMYNYRAECRSAQSNYARYYRIVQQCASPDGVGYFFLYTDR